MTREDAGSISGIGPWSGDRFAHEALVFGDDDQLLERCLPFVLEALAAGQPILVMTSDGTFAILSERLGADAERLDVLGAPEDRWHGGHETLLAYDRDFRRVAAGGLPWRLIAEPTWLERADGQEWHRFESASNRLLSSVPYYSLCLHDRRRLDDAVLRTVRRTHPLVCDERGLRFSEEFVEPESLVRSLEPPWSPVPSDAESADVTRAVDGRVVTAAAVDAAGLPGRRDEIVLAVGEVLANSLERFGTATIESWRDEAHLFVQISDGGGGGIDALAGYRPPSDASESGRGLWLARALADDATLRSGPAGSAVRLLFRLPVER